jgi:hypothetical protein
MTKAPFFISHVPERNKDKPGFLHKEKLQIYPGNNPVNLIGG